MGRIFRGKKKKKKRKEVPRMFSSSSTWWVQDNYRLKTAQRYSEYPLGKAFQQTGTEIPEEIVVNR